MVKRLPLDPIRTAGSKLDLELVAAFCKFAKRGQSFDAICDYLEIESATFWAWWRRGLNYIAEKETPRKHFIYGYLVKQLKKAHAQYLFGLVDELHDKTNEEWRREMSILERRDRRTYGKHEPAGGTSEDLDPDERFL